MDSLRNTYYGIVALMYVEGYEPNSKRLRNKIEESYKLAHTESFKIPSIFTNYGTRTGKYYVKLPWFLTLYKIDLNYTPIKKDEEELQITLFR